VKVRLRENIIQGFESAAPYFAFFPFSVPSSGMKYEMRIFHTWVIVF
jgi:hypothetical protein